MKIYSWIDKYNQKNSFKIIQKYHFGCSAGKTKFYFLHTSFWLKYILRLFLVFASIVLFRKRAYQTFLKIISSRFSPFISPQKSSVHIKLHDIISTLFGYRYFSDIDTLPLLDNRNLLKSKVELPAFTDPLVSIIIPVYNHLDYSYNCLKSIELNVSGKFPYEVIVVDDCSTDLTEKFIRSNAKNVSYLKNESNLGFLLTCNAGAKLAKGRFLCFLNNDVQVKQVWLESLVNTFEDDTVGLVGSKLIYADGMLQEAGGIVFNDANAANYGNYEYKDHPSFNFAREVDYCSGASIILLKEDFEKLGGFDNRYIPAYYEDTDLCLAVKHTLGKKVIYQPFSELVHFEGVSSGTDITKDTTKKYQAINKEKFYKKWKSQLSYYPAIHDFRSALAKFNREKTILIIDDTIPEPDKDSGSLRLIHIIKILKSLGYHLIFFPNDGIKKERYFENLAKLGIEVIYRFPNRNSMFEILSDKISSVDVVWICKPQNNTVYDSITKHGCHIKRIYDTIDLHFLRMQREAELNNDNLLLIAAQNTKKEELQYAAMADITIAITNDEKKILENEGLKNVVVIPNIHVIESAAAGDVPFRERNGILFIGGFVHKPNVDAVKWLINEIMPIVWKTHPEIEVTLLGSNPSDEVLQLKALNVNVPGYIEDVSPYFYTSKIFVAPLRYGAGMKGKIGQSLSYGLPIITSNIGAEGMSLTPDTHFLLADKAEEFAAKILMLYNNEQLWHRLSVESKASISNYHPDNVKKTIQLMLARLNK